MRGWRFAFSLFVLLVLPAIAVAQDTVIYYHTDAVGSVRMITDANGQVVARYDYTPFGEPWSPPSPADVRQFAGKERDPETGFNYFGARYYASQSGRFTTVDPGHVAGVIFNPQTWNGYAYALNNPPAIRRSAWHGALSDYAPGRRCCRCRCRRWRHCPRRVRAWKSRSGKLDVSQLFWTAWRLLRPSARNDGRSGAWSWRARSACS